MLRFRWFVHFCKPKPVNFSQGSLPGFKPLEAHAEEAVTDCVNRRVFQSKSVRQRRRRNVMKRIYGSSYDHEMDDYR